MTNIYSVTVRNRFAAIVFAVAVLGLGALLFTVGLALLAALAVAGGVLAVGLGVYHRLSGGRRPFPRASGRNRPALDGTPLGSVDGTLDPTLEVRPVRPAIVSPTKSGEE